MKEILCSTAQEGWSFVPLRFFLSAWKDTCTSVSYPEIHDKPRQCKTKWLNGQREGASCHTRVLLSLCKGHPALCLYTGRPGGQHITGGKSSAEGR